MTKATETVPPVDRATWGAPPHCPRCGGRLALAAGFGQTIDDAGARYPYLDPSVAQCEDCRAMFQVRL